VVPSEQLFHSDDSTITSAGPTSSPSPTCTDGDEILTLHGLLNRMCAATTSSCVLIRRSALESKSIPSHHGLAYLFGAMYSSTHPTTKCHSAAHIRLTTIKPLPTPLHSQFYRAALQTVAVHSGVYCARRTAQPAFGSFTFFSTVVAILTIQNWSLNSQVARLLFCLKSSPIIFCAFLTFGLSSH
jgi:hypothetical protein